ncbi:TPA: hypothetical protein N0F65_007933 [Lagenidium giganteum]|uniref:Uncharacterized protein n=1 Tax=Lagenidium giganteum TaxID=4803 RepID=A0AAV2YLX7_9STRA|nr:TPA: hypothetical protein N0F65_007933 [Lagenidium giganteum]
MDHLRRAHLEEYPLEFQLLRRQARGMDSFVTVTENVTSRYRWLEWVVMGGLPHNFCEKPLMVQKHQPQAEIYNHPEEAPACR